MPTNKTTRQRRQQWRRTSARVHRTSEETKWCHSVQRLRQASIECRVDTRMMASRAALTHPRYYYRQPKMSMSVVREFGRCFFEFQNYVFLTAVELISETIVFDSLELLVEIEMKAYNMRHVNQPSGCYIIKMIISLNVHVSCCRASPGSREKVWCILVK